MNASPTVEYYTVPDLVELFGVAPGKIHRLLEQRTLAAVRVNGVLSIPKVFVQDSEPLHSLQGTLVLLSDAGFADDEAVAWLLAENEELGGRPIDALLAGRKSEVRRIAQSLAF